VSPTELPVLLVVATPGDAAALKTLFSSRGFVVRARSVDEVASGTRRRPTERMPNAALVDLGVPDARRALNTLSADRPGLALVAILAADETTEVQDLLDAAFQRPVDPARLFARVVELVAARRNGAGKGRRGHRITGVLGVVTGNDLFEQVTRELTSVVPPVNAGAILEKALRDLGSDPFVLKEPDLAAILASGRLAEALTPFGDPVAITAAVSRLERLVAGGA
jgi:hypothetical protein